VSSLSAWLVTGLPQLVAFGAVLGCGIATAGAICNLLVIEGTDLVHRSRFLCALHTMYGFASFVSPIAVGVILGWGFSWPWVVAAAMPLFLALGIFSAIALPSHAYREETTRSQGGFSFLEILVIVIFVFYVAAEVLTSMWMVPYLVEVRQLDAVTSGLYLSLFFLAMALSRFLCFFSLKAHQETIILFACGALFAIASVCAHAGWAWALPLTGLIGPFYPLFLSRVSRRFPLSAERLTLWILTFCQLSLALGHLFVGRLTDQWGIERTYLIPLGLMVLTFVGVIFYLREEGKPLLQ
jgi:fucose permease